MRCCDGPTQQTRTSWYRTAGEGRSRGRPRGCELSPHMCVRQSLLCTRLPCSVCSSKSHTCDNHKFSRLFATSQSQHRLISSLFVMCAPVEHFAPSPSTNISFTSTAPYISRFKKQRLYCMSGEQRDVSLLSREQTGRGVSQLYFLTRQQNNEQSSSAAHKHCNSNK
jgi:hypothetical protein